MFSAAKYTVFSIVLCINITQSSDRSGFFLWFYAWKKRGNVDRTFLRSINGYLLWGDSGILYSAISVDRVCERNVSESFLSGWYQTSDDPDLRKWLRIEFSNLSASFPSKKKDPFRVLSFHIMIPEMVYTLVITIALYFIILKINRHLETIEKRSAAKFVW